MSFLSYRFIKGDLPNKPTEPHTSYTQRRGAYAIEVGRASVLPKVPITDRGQHLQVERQVLGLSQVAAVAAGTVSVAGEVSRTSQETCGTAKLESWVVKALSSYMGGGLTHISVQVESLS